MSSFLRLFNALVTWNSNFEDNPSGDDSPSYGDDEIRLLKSAFRERFEKGHMMNLASGTVASDGWHKSGSAKLYYQASAPTTRPDGTTALTADDNGRRWVRSTDKREYTYAHPDWVAVTVLEGANNTFSGDNTFSGENTFSKHILGMTAGYEIHGESGSPMVGSDIWALFTDHVFSDSGYYSQTVKISGALRWANSLMLLAYAELPFFDQLELYGVLLSVDPGDSALSVSDLWYRLTILDTSVSTYTGVISV